ncbi:MAG: fumarylacetoacetase [Zetaproteobacteria bacterium]|nr:fumarylacetoacetase [Pseudobdellovibrionaceae bacterium]
MNSRHPELKSFIEVEQNSDFPIQNLPYGVFKCKNKPTPRVGVAIGSMLIDLDCLESKGLLKLSQKVFHHSSLNEFINLGKVEWDKTRQKLRELLSFDCPIIRDKPVLKEQCLHKRSEVEMLLPIQVGDYTDFYSSIEHASNVGSMFRDKNNPLLPNWKHLPVGYHGRASSIVVSGSNIKRPVGQIKQSEQTPPHLQACAKLDFELELAAVIGKKSKVGQTIKLEEAPSHVFGFVLMNDWSARDIQKWEYVPLGPFVSKSFATSVSPWVIPMSALEPFKVKGPQQDPTPLKYLQHQENDKAHFDINLSISLQGKEHERSKKISQTNSKSLYWSLAQQITHHTITGCNINVGDLMASGTISGQEKNSYGSMLELSWNGQKPIQIDENNKRSFLEDYDQVIMNAWSECETYKLGFGELTGQILPAAEL